EIPRAPVLGVDRPEPLAGGALEPEALLPEDVLLDDRSDGPAGAVRDLDPRLHDLPRAEELDHLRPLAVVHRQPMREELVEVGDQPRRLLEHGLAFLADVADVVALLVADLVLVRELDQLRFLVDHEDVAAEEVGHGSSLACLGIPEYGDAPRTRKGWRTS